MIAGVAFDLYGPQFSVGEVAAVLGIKPSVLAMRAKRGYDQPSRREGASDAKRRKKRLRQGKGLFSARDMVKIQTQQILSDMGFLLSESVPVGDEIKLTPKTVAKHLSDMEAGEIAYTVAMTGEWMWAVARAFERGEHLHVYVYATHDNQKGWQFDMHVFDRGKPPCFGWEVPHIYLPMSDIFIDIYTACKKVLGITTARDESP